MDVKIVLDQLVETCTIDLFECFGAGVKPGFVDGAPDRVAVIGFTGDGVRGAFALGVSRELFAHVSTPCGADDWLAECANQLLGRVKNRLLRYGVDVKPAIPLVLHGGQIEPMLGIAAGVGTEVWMYPFHGKGGTVCVWLAVMGADQLDLSPSEDPDAHSAIEGEMVFF